MVDMFGWQGIFGAAAALALLSAVLALLGLPKAAWHREPPQSATEAKSAGSAFASARTLFKGGYAVTTMIIWALFALNLSVNYSLLSWLPALLDRAGWDIASASRISGVIAMCGIIGSLCISCLSDRGFSIATLLVVYSIAIAALATFAMGLQFDGLWVVLLAVIGFTAFGAQTAISSITAMYYPISIRSTAVGWSSAFGRIGAIAGPWAIGTAMAGSSSTAMILAALAIPMVGCLLAVALLPGARARIGGGSNGVLN